MMGQDGDSKGAPPFVRDRDSAGADEYRTVDPENRQVIHHTCIRAAGAPAFYSHEEKEK